MRAMRDLIWICSGTIFCLSGAMYPHYFLFYGPLLIGLLLLWVFLILGPRQRKKERLAAKRWERKPGAQRPKKYRRSKEGSAEAKQDPTPPDDIETRLQRLEDLKEKGLLTDAEYQAKREEILGGG